MTTERIDVMATLSAAIAVLDSHQCHISSEAIREVRSSVAELIEAVKAWDRWNYEVQSARVNGESVYSYDELTAMRSKAVALSDAALARVSGG